MADFSRQFPKFLENKEVYIAIGSIPELVSPGFLKQEDNINKLINRNNVFLLKHIFPLNEEIVILRNSIYTKTTDIKKMILMIF